ncbi:MAG: adenylate kinase [Candidatus Omnitrophota bacterium]
MRLIFLGPPGAGKGTQAKVIAQLFTAAHLSTGEILREAVKNNTEVGKRAKSYMDKGELVPDEVVIKIVAESLARPDIARGFILDGFPRTEQQAIALDGELAKISLAIDAVIYFDTSAEVSIRRLSGRRVCRKCGANYHIASMKSRQEGVCDICAGELYQRDDDKEATVKNRLVVYERQTAALIEYYKNKGMLETVSGDLDVDAVRDHLTALFKAKRL